MALAATASGCLGQGAGAPRAPAGDDARPLGDPALGDPPNGDPAPTDEALPPPPILEGNNASRALGFELFYRERLLRHLTVFNRFGLAGDAVFGVAVANNRVARSGNDYEVLVGPTDNNPIGKSIFQVAQAYRLFGGHELELTLIRMFEGLVFLEAVSGHPGLTSRMALPGWTLTLDGIADSVERSRGGVSVASPMPYAPVLESAILDTFFAGARITYWENPEEQYALRYPVARLESYAVTYVFAGLPTFLRISNCCASYIISQKGPWQGAYWSNHNSRDNFPDLTLGYLAAVDLLRDPELPSDLWVAAQRARVAGERVGARVIADGSKLMTVSEYLSYEELIPGGATRPDLRADPSDLGSLNTCQLVYLAAAVSPLGLDLPEPVLPLGDSGQSLALRSLLAAVGVTAMGGETTECRSLDDAIFGRTWTDILTAEVLGVPWLDLLDELAQQRPEEFVSLVAGSLNDLEFVTLAAAALVYYAEVASRTALEARARQAFTSLILLQRALATSLLAALGEPPDPGIAYSAVHARYLAAVVGSSFGVETAASDFGDFGAGRTQAAQEDDWWALADTRPAPLLSDAEIVATIEADLSGRAADEPWLVDRYRTRFTAGPPVRRAGDGYEAIDMHGQWVATANARHRVYNKHTVFFELPLCARAPEVLSCAWARLGCARPDLDGSGVVDAADQARFATARAAAVGVVCAPANAWCQGADLDRNYVVDDDDAAFMSAAQGCVR